MAPSSHPPRPRTRSRAVDVDAEREAYDPGAAFTLDDAIAPAR
jgi:hypothetical protein